MDTGKQTVAPSVSQQGARYKQGVRPDGSETICPAPARYGHGRGTLGILLFIAGRGRKAYWNRDVGGEGGGAEPIQ